MEPNIRRDDEIISAIFKTWRPVPNVPNKCTDLVDPSYKNINMNQSDMIFKHTSIANLNIDTLFLICLMICLLVRWELRY